MITEQELLALCQDLESDRIERTISFDKNDKFAQAICAFSNDFPNHKTPGYLLIGVKDDGGESDIRITDELLLTLAAIRSNGNIQPIPTINVFKMTPSKYQHEIAVVEVLPSDLPPVRYKGQVWIRVGPSRAIASETEERILTERRQSNIVNFDARPCVDSRIDDLVLDLFILNYRPNAIASDIIEENHREIKQQLASLRFYNTDKDCPTHAGILLFGRNLLQWIPGAYIQFVRFDGTKMTDDVIDEKEFSGDLLTILRDLDTFVPLQLQTKPQSETALKEKSVFDYPIIAIREILLNAIMHRQYESYTPIRFYWFSDRIEIQNPGGLYGDATPENFPNQNAYRNPVLAEALKVLGYVNKYGRGVFRANDALKRNGNPIAEFKFETTYVLVTIWRRE